MTPSVLTKTLKKKKKKQEKSLNTAKIPDSGTVDLSLNWDSSIYSLSKSQISLTLPYLPGKVAGWPGAHYVCTPGCP